MAKVPKHKRIKRATVLTKRTRCLKSSAKNKSYLPFYQKLKHNNHTLAKALSQEKQENQLLFSRNVELLGEVQDLVHACNNREHVITNVLKSAKQMMSMIVNMSECLTNTISSCQEFVSTQGNTQRSSSSSISRRESSKRLSTKSPARGVVKPMVSGHTITKPTINLSRVNMQRLQNINLSIIDEASATPERNIDEPNESRRTRATLPERLPVTALRTEDDDERIILRRTNRFSGGRLSSGRYSKRNSGRLSGRLAKRSSEYVELNRSPRVLLENLRLTNNQRLSARLSSNNMRQSVDQNASRMGDIDTSELSPNGSSPDMITDTQNGTSDTSDSEQGVSVSEKSSTLKESNNSSHNDLEQDPLEGPSWLFDSHSTVTDDTRVSQLQENPSSPVSSISNGERRRSSGVFRVPKLPVLKNARLNLSNDFTSPASVTAKTTNGYLDDSDTDDDDGNRRVNLGFITQRRGPSSRMGSAGSRANDNDLIDDDDDADDETIMLNMKRQLRTQVQPVEEPERLQFDMNELLQLTPLKPLMSIGSRTNNGPAQVEPEIENNTATVQLTQRLPKIPESRDSFVVNSSMSTVVAQVHQPETAMRTGVEENDRRFSDLTTTRIEVPRLTDICNVTDDHHTQMILTPENVQPEKRRRVMTKHFGTVVMQEAVSDNNENEAPNERKKKPKQRKKLEDKDPSAAKVVLKKLNQTTRNSSLSEAPTSERKNSDESVASTRSSTLSRADQSSDSESSNASYSSKQIQMRPRRQKAPKNLQEPSLTKKLRR